MLAGLPEIAEVTVFKYDFPVPIAPDDSPERGEKERTRERKREGKRDGGKSKISRTRTLSQAPRSHERTTVQALTNLCRRRRTT